MNDSPRTRAHALVEAAGTLLLLTAAAKQERSSVRSRCCSGV
jgi:hypothetical protein